jgi:phosphate transport system ATP-binding protein
MQQARRISDKTGFMYMGKMVEFGDTEKVFDSPAQERTMKYVSGMFG